MTFHTLCPSAFRAVLFIHSSSESVIMLPPSARKSRIRSKPNSVRAKEGEKKKTHGRFTAIQTRSLKTTLALRFHPSPPSASTTLEDNRRMKKNERQKQTRTAKHHYPSRLNLASSPGRPVLEPSSSTDMGLHKNLNISPSQKELNRINRSVRRRGGNEG